MNCNTILISQNEFSSTKFITFELKQTQMNVKPVIAWTFIGSLVLLVLYFLLSQFTDCSTPNTGIWQSLNSQKSSFCSFIDTVKTFAYGGFVIGGVIYLINYFGFGDKDAHY